MDGLEVSIAMGRKYRCAVIKAYTRCLLLARLFMSWRRPQRNGGKLSMPSAAASSENALPPTQVLYQSVCERR